jgi:pimeloyl-ACP methyl ester carboxylesterase
MPYIETNGVDLYYETLGAGTPLMLIAGLASDSQSWSTISGELSKHFMLIIPDNRGVGRTSPQDTETSIQRIADDCVSLIRHLGLKSVSLLGHSMGGFVAMDIAIRYPEVVERLVLCGTAASSSKRNNSLLFNWAASLDAGLDPHLFFRDIFSWLFTPAFFEDEDFVNVAVKFAVEYPYSQSAKAFLNQVRAIADFDCAENLSWISAKTLVIHGKEDLLFLPEEGARLAQAIPNASMLVIEKAAHSIHVEQPRAFIDCILAFLMPDK